MRDDEVPELVAAHGLADAPLALSVRSPTGDLDWVQGTWAAGTPVAARDRFYGASLAKQVTGAAVAVLVQRGLLDVDAPIGAIFRELPDWLGQVTPRHLLHHLGGLPEVVRESAGEQWTNAKVLELLLRETGLRSPPGTVFRYSNVGYICLVGVIERVSGASLASFVRESLFDPPGLGDLDFTTAPDFPQLTGMGEILPLTQGSGGIWTSAAAFANWLDHLNRDTLGVATLVQQPGHLADGTLNDYGWGIGLRKLGAHDLFIHAGGWPGAYSKSTRCPALGLSIVGLAATDADAGVIALVNAVTDRFAAPSELG